MHSLSLRVAVLALVCFSLSSCDKDAPDPESGKADCATQVDSYLQSVVRCIAFSDDERQTLIERCEDGRFKDIRANWRPEFTAAVDRCAQGLTCSQLQEDLDDICFPVALQHTAGDLISATTREACLQQGSERCEMVVASGSEQGGSVASRCLVAWHRCEDQREDSEPYWSEDYCLTAIALKDDSRTKVDACLSKGCTEIPTCIEQAGAFGY